MSAAAARLTVRDRLRDATVEAHAALEAELDLATTLRTRADLAAVLARFHGFFHPVETALDTLLGPDIMGDRHRAPALRADLGTLGLSPAAIAALPRCADAALASASEGWGALYVLEGARLGGRIIARDLAARGIARDLRFWTDAAPATAPSWPDFVAGLETVPDPPAAGRAAQATFTRLHAWMAVRQPAAG